MISRKKKMNSVEEDSSKYKVKLSVKIGGRLIESDIEDSLSIPTVDKLNPTMIANMMAEIPSLHARWNFLYNEAVFEYDISHVGFYYKIKFEDSFQARLMHSIFFRHKLLLWFV